MSSEPRRRQGQKKSVGLVPRLRFPEFQEAGEWEERELGDLCDICTGRKDANEGSPNGQYPFFTCADQHSFSDTYSYDAEAILIAGNAHVGQTRYYKGKFEAYQRTYVLTGFRNIYTSYLFAFLGATLQASLSAQAQTSAMSYIRLPMLKGYNVIYPHNANEQKKIADCLSSLDDLITLESRKLDALKQHKRGLMQQLFPAEGETVPRLRFPEFREAGEWHAKSLGELCNILNNRRKPITSTERKAGEYPYYGASGIVDYIDDYIFDEELLLIGEDGAKWGAYEASSFIVYEKCWVNNHAHVLKPLGVDIKIVEAYLNMKDLNTYVTGAAPPKLTLGKLKEILVPVPPSVEEQVKIASTLYITDGLITAQRKKIESLKTHKKGLMQQLFPALDDAVA
ncbi:restriction endonuclease subunit S [Acidithiobacillus sp. AMEEHan]|uniref:restriction endonuclease subunit S n=1 Tax=Acidithiobacillus sp. AMEEHan TaxID=2994951 RepID=UPI0027E49D31|nr:restriction endonuclease subunit S [Acidithiobacillus sp. AMEEHan]